MLFYHVPPYSETYITMSVCGWFGGFLEELQKSAHYLNGFMMCLVGLADMSTALSHLLSESFFLCLCGYQDGGFRQHLQRAQYVHGRAHRGLWDNFPRNWKIIGHPWWAGTGHEHPWWNCDCLCHLGVLHQRRKCAWMDMLCWSYGNDTNVSV